MIPQSLLGDPCAIAVRWTISLQLADRLTRGAALIERAGLGVTTIISGFRTCDEQDALREAGRPAADCDKSTHTVCPATGADIWVPAAGEEVAQGARLAVVAIMEGVGLRMGGGGPIAANGLPVDWNHADLGPRSGQAAAVVPQSAAVSGCPAGWQSKVAGPEGFICVEFASEVGFVLAGHAPRVGGVQRATS